MTDRPKHEILTSLHLFKLTPGINCGQCGFRTCLAFSTQVMVGKGDPKACPYLDPKALAPFRTQLEALTRTEGFEKTFDFLRSEVGKCDLRLIAGGLGAVFEERSGLPCLLLDYFGRRVRIAADDILFEGALDPWEKILLYNYVVGGAVEPLGVLVGMESLPNSVSKVKSLKTHCEDPLAQAFAGRLSLLSSAVVGLGHPLSDDAVDYGAEFPILPKLAVRVLWWDEDPGEGFQARTKFLFDARVLQVVDLESLIFACEQLTKRLLHSQGQSRGRSKP